MNTKSGKRDAAIGVLVVLACIASFTVGSTTGYVNGVERTRIEVVKRGYGEWVVSHNGDTAFRWKEDGK